MSNEFLSKKSGRTEFNNFFHKLEHSISISNIHGILTDSEYHKAKERLVKKFIASLEKSNYKCIAPKISIGPKDDVVDINKGDIIELISIDKSNKEVSIGFKDFKYGMDFDFMLIFKKCE